MLKSSTSRISSLRTSYSLGLSFILALVFVSMLFAQQAHAQATAQATVAWNADTGQVAGYDVYYGSSSGKYTTTLNAGNTTSATLTNLSAQTYYIAVTAYNSSNTQSGYSPELVVDSLTASAGSGGTISPSGTFFQTQGGSQTFTISPSSGYTTASVLVDGTSVGAVSSYTFSNIAANHTISATFTAGAANYTITASAGANGTISPSGAVSVNSGANESFTVTPSTGYSIGTVTGCNGTLSGNTYTTGSITSACTVTASFAANTTSYTVTPSAGTGGSINPSTAQTVNYDGTTSFTVTPKTGYSVGAVTGCNGSLSGNTYKTGPITSACTVSASFAANTTSYTVTPSAGTGGNINPSTAQTVSYDGTTSFTVTPKTGYSIGAVTGCNGSLSGNTYTTGQITSACTVSASFAANSTTYTITASPGANGTMSPSGAVKVSTGGSQTFTVTPASSSYQVANVLVDGATVGALTSYTFSGVTANHTISATFAAKRSSSTLHHMVWAGQGGYAAIWTLDSSNNMTADLGYGPYSGWTPVSFSSNSDGTRTLVWAGQGEYAAIWTLDSSNNMTD